MEIHNIDDKKQIRELETEVQMWQNQLKNVTENCKYKKRIAEATKIFDDFPNTCRGHAMGTLVYDAEAVDKWREKLRVALKTGDKMQE